MFPRDEGRSGGADLSTSIVQVDQQGDAGLQGEGVEDVRPGHL